MIKTNNEQIKTTAAAVVAGRASETHRVAVLLTPDQHQLIAHVANHNNMSNSHLVRHLIENLAADIVRQSSPANGQPAQLTPIGVTITPALQ